MISKPAALASSPADLPGLAGGPEPGGLRSGLRWRRRPVLWLTHAAFLLIALFLIFLGVWQVRLHLQAARMAEIQGHSAMALDWGQDISKRLDSNFRDLNFFRQILRLQGPAEILPNTATVQALKGFQDSHRSALGINILNAAGSQILWSTHRQSSRPLMRPGDFYAAGNNPAWLVGNPQWAPRYNTWIIPMRVLVHGPQGQALGAIGRPTPLALVAPAGLAPGAYLALLDRHGKILGYWQGRQWIGGPLPEHSDGMLHAEVNVHAYPWSLTVWWPQPSVWNSLSPVAWLALLAPLALMLMILLLFDRLAQRLLIRLLDHGQYQDSLLALNRALMQQNRLPDLYRITARQLAGREGFLACLIFAQRAGEPGLRVCAADSRDPRLTPLLASPDAIPGALGDGESLPERALREGRLIQGEGLGDCPMGRALLQLRPALQIGSLFAQPIPSEPPDKTGGLVLVLMTHRRVSLGPAFTAFLWQAANGLGLVLSLWARQTALGDAQQALQTLASHDPLTGAANRQALERYFQQQMESLGQSSDVLALIFMDLDDFHELNARWGRPLADQLLVRLVQRLQAALRRDDLVARLGGDEFVVLLRYSGTQAALEHVLTTLETVFTTPLPLPNGTLLQLHASMGVAPLTSSRHSLDALLRDAEQTLFVVKAHKADRLHLWAISGQELQTRPRSRAQQLLQTGGLEVWYQPVVHADTGRVVGIEALARLRDADGAILFPSDFLPYLSATDLQELSWQVLDQALQDIEALEAAGRCLWVSFNVPAESFTQYCLPCLQGVLGKYAVAPERITMEILESSDFLDRPLAAEVMGQIRQLGLHLALDDVGSAYASLQRIKDLPIDKIKLDQHFIRSLPERPQDIHFVRILQDLAMELHVELVVEGVETPEILDALVTLGVPHLQGYAIARPMTLSHLFNFLESQRRPSIARPATLFGLFAGLVTAHATLKKMLLVRSEGFLSAGAELLHYQPFAEALNRLGYQDPQVPLMMAYGAYLRQLNSAVASRERPGHGPLWAAAESALHDLQNLLLAERLRGIDDNA